MRERGFNWDFMLGVYDRRVNCMWRMVEPSRANVGGKSPAQPSPQIRSTTNKKQAFFSKKRERAAHNERSVELLRTVPSIMEQQQCKQTRTSPQSERRRVLHILAEIEWRFSSHPITTSSLPLNFSPSGVRLLFSTSTALRRLFKGTVG